MSSVSNNTPGTRLELWIKSRANLAAFTTLLQYGMYLDTRQGCSISELLCSLPGFSEEYIVNNVQTIFLNGFPADDLQQQISGKNAVLAISAAMPGLAGAIFRKGGFHASLRTAPDETNRQPVKNTVIHLRLKLFNMIAKDRGVQILHEGCTIQAATLADFLLYREIPAKDICRAQSNKNEISPEEPGFFPQGNQFIHLSIKQQA